MMVPAQQPKPELTAEQIAEKGRIDSILTNGECAIYGPTGTKLISGQYKGRVYTMNGLNCTLVETDKVATFVPINQIGAMVFIKPATDITSGDLSQTDSVPAEEPA